MTKHMDRELVLVPSVEEARTCSKCEISKPILEFKRDGHGRLCFVCLSCTAIQKKAGYNKRLLKKLITEHGAEEGSRRFAARSQVCPPGYKLCSHCLYQKPLIEFRTRKQARDGFLHWCRSCDYEMVKDRLTRSPESRLKAALENAKGSTRDVSVALPDLVALWEKQKGQCFYSGEEMTFNAGNKYTTVSLDRVDSSKGYAVDNIVLCCAFVNRMKNDVSVDAFVAWCEKIVKHVRGSK